MRLLLIMILCVSALFGQERTDPSNKVRYAANFVGATGGAKIIAAIADGPATGVIVDARGVLQNTILTDLAAVTKPVRIILGQNTWSVPNNVTIPSNIVLEAEPGTIILVSDGKVLTFNSIASIDAGSYTIFSGNLIQTTGTLTVAGNASDGNTVTLGWQVYTMRNSPSVAYDVEIGGSATASLTNLCTAITSGDSSPAFIANAAFTCTGSTATTLDIAARHGGRGGNFVAKASAWGSWSALSGGNAPVLFSNAGYVGGAKVQAAWWGLTAGCALSNATCGQNNSAAIQAAIESLPQFLDGHATEHGLLMKTGSVELPPGRFVIWDGFWFSSYIDFGGTPNQGGTTLEFADGAATNTEKFALRVSRTLLGGVAPSAAFTQGASFHDLTLAGNPSARAVGTFTLSAQATTGSTVTIGGRVYTFRSTLSSGPTVADEIKIGSTVRETLNNFAAALLHTNGEGVKYSTGTTKSATVAVPPEMTSTSIKVKAITFDAATGNAITTTETDPNGSWGGATLSGGVDHNAYTSCAAITTAQIGLFRNLVCAAFPRRGVVFAGDPETLNDTANNVTMDGVWIIGPFDVGPALTVVAWQSNFGVVSPEHSNWDGAYLDSDGDFVPSILVQSSVGVSFSSLQDESSMMALKIKSSVNVEIDSFMSARYLNIAPLGDVMIRVTGDSDHVTIDSYIATTGGWLYPLKDDSSSAGKTRNVLRGGTADSYDGTVGWRGVYKQTLAVADAIRIGERQGATTIGTNYGESFTVVSLRSDQTVGGTDPVAPGAKKWTFSLGGNEANSNATTALYASETDASNSRRFFQFSRAHGGVFAGSDVILDPDGETTTSIGNNLNIAGGGSKTIGADVFFGTGLNDLTQGGTYTGTIFRLYRVVIDGTGAPDTFKWYDNGALQASGVAITGSAQTLNNGVTVTFGATTGHTLNSFWEIRANIGHEFKGVLYHENTADRSYKFPNASGTVALETSSYTGITLNNPILGSTTDYTTNSLQLYHKRSLLSNYGITVSATNFTGQPGDSAFGLAFDANDRLTLLRIPANSPAFTGTHASMISTYGKVSFALASNCVGINRQDCDYNLDVRGGTGIGTDGNLTLRVGGGNAFIITGVPTGARQWDIPDVDDTFVGVNATQTLLAKTLTTPTIVATGWTNANHAHLAANSGGTLSAAAIASGTFDAARLPDLSGTYLSLSAGGTVAGATTFSTAITANGGLTSTSGIGAAGFNPTGFTGATTSPVISGCTLQFVGGVLVGTSGC